MALPRAPRPPRSLPLAYLPDAAGTDVSAEHKIAQNTFFNHISKEIDDEEQSAEAIRRGRVASPSLSCGEEPCRGGGRAQARVAREDPAGTSLSASRGC